MNTLTKNRASLLMRRALVALMLTMVSIIGVIIFNFIFSINNNGSKAFCCIMSRAEMIKKQIRSSRLRSSKCDLSEFIATARSETGKNMFAFHCWQEKPPFIT